MAQQQKLQLRDQQQQQPLAAGGTTKTLAAGIGSIQQQTYSEKRKHHLLECDSDEDDFAGFDEDATNSENGILNSPRETKPTSAFVNTKIATTLSSSGRFTTERDSLTTVTTPTKNQDEMEPLMEIGTASAGTGIFEPSIKGISTMTMATGQPKRKVPLPTNTQDEAYRLPFKYGWKRELVYRANSDGSSKDKGEVYYITPAGKKLRTRNDIVMALHDGLTMDNFTFMKDPVGGSPDEEIIRSAKSSAPRRIVNTSSPAGDPVIESSLGKRIPKPKMPKGASPPPSFPRSNVAQARTPPTSRTPGQTTSPKANANIVGRSPMLGTSVPKLNENSFSITKSGKTKSKVETCTIQCLPAMGMIPQLQCISCLCMYHPECVEATTAEILARRFTCKICFDEQSTTSEFEGVNRSVSGTNTVLPLSTQSLNNGNASVPQSVDKQKKPTPPQQPPKTGPGTSKTTSKELPPQDVIVVGNHQFIVVPKGKPATTRNKKQPKLLQQQPPLQSQSISNIQQLTDDSRKSASTLKPTPNQSGNRLGAGVGGQTSRSESSIPPPSLVTGMEQNRLFASNFFSNVSIGYDVLQQTFQYLKVQELLRASCVCRMWNQVANHPRLWKTVRMKNSLVNDWNGLAKTLRKNGTKHLDLRKMLISGNSDEMWQKFSTNISLVYDLERIDLCRCSSTIVGNLLKSNPNLKIINALVLKSDPIDFTNYEHGQHLHELRLKSSTAVAIGSELSQLKSLSNLKHLSLTSVLKLGSTSIKALGELVNLESLELGECTEIGQNFAEILPSLNRLQRLRLEKGQENFNMLAILDSVSGLRNLYQLELINCDVKTGFDEHIHKCNNIRRLLLIPTYVSQSAATNNMVLSGVAKLRDTLEIFIWTVTVELLRVTELYIDQCDTKSREEKTSPGESIPILKPVPGVDDVSISNSANTSTTPLQVEIVPLSTVNNILDKSLPKTKLKILRIPFASTWKQGMLDLF